MNEKHKTENINSQYINFRFYIFIANVIINNPQKLTKIFEEKGENHEKKIILLCRTDNKDLCC